MSGVVWYGGRRQLRLGGAEADNRFLCGMV
jgi:hypothetical protein